LAWFSLSLCPGRWNSHFSTPGCLQDAPFTSLTTLGQDRVLDKRYTSSLRAHKRRSTLSRKVFLLVREHKP